MKFAELNEQGFVTGINNIGGDGWVPCDGLTEWQIQHQGDLRFTNGAWDASGVAPEPVPGAPSKEDHVQAIKATLIEIAVPQEAADSIAEHLGALVGV